jgi:hypothetical protein
MNQYLQQLNDLAAQNEGGGGDNNGSNEVAPGRFISKDNKTGEFIIRDRDNNEIARSADQQQAISQAKKSQYPGKQIQVPNPATKSQPSLFVEPSGPRAVFNDEIDVEEQSMPQSPLGPDLRPIQPRQPGEFDATPMQTRMPNVSTDPAKAVLQGASSQTGSAVFGGSVATPTAGEAPGQEEPQRERRRGGGATWEAPGEAMELTQEDFYTTPGPMVGQYDTGNEYVARSARMPMGALSKAAATLQNRQLEIDQKRQAFQEELYKPIKTATPYQQNFNAIVNRQREEFLQKVAQDLTGGNINKAYREIFSNPRLRAQYRQLNADLEALGQRGAATFEKVTNYLNQAATNKIQSTPEQRQLANDIAMGLGGYSAADGTGGSFEKLINDMNRWDLMEGRDQYFKNTIGPSIKDFFQKIPKEIGWEIKNGRYRLLTEESVKSWDNHIRQLAVDMAVWQGYGAGDLPEEKIQDNINYLTNMLGQQVDREIKVIDTYANISRGDGGGGNDKATYSSSNPVETQSIVSTAWGTQGTKALDPLKPDVFAVTLTAKVGNQNVEAGKMPFEKIDKDGGKQAVDLIPFRIEQSKQFGDGFIIGYNPNDTEVKSIIDRGGHIVEVDTNAEGGADVSVKQEDGTITVRKISRRGINYVPLNSVNVETIKSTWPGIQDKLRKMTASGSAIGIDSLPE